ncbi:unnamed protein product [Gongylonema pulchrum]|uniref:Secreted protein n=1 Tax=Gongylonema pulchrum TaxID=637853 RepID=A0A183D0V0_9BILA|nr:unnamed protein product [Gongylonema pulchrum]
MGSVADFSGKFLVLTLVSTPTGCRLPTSSYQPDAVYHQHQHTDQTPSTNISTPFANIRPYLPSSFFLIVTCYRINVLMLPLIDKNN